MKYSFGIKDVIKSIKFKIELRTIEVNLNPIAFLRSNINSSYTIKHQRNNDQSIAALKKGGNFKPIFLQFLTINFKSNNIFGRNLKLFSYTTLLFQLRRSDSASTLF
ncbi:hypothetical protein AAHE18_01G032200 [Arachis hypogaea]